MRFMQNLFVFLADTFFYYSLLFIDQLTFDPILNIFMSYNLYNKLQCFQYFTIILTSLNFIIIKKKLIWVDSLDSN